VTIASGLVAFKHVRLYSRRDRYGFESDLVDIAAWLRQVGLERYEQAFREHCIDAERLAELTADDLIALGLTSVGHRRKLLSAAARHGGPVTTHRPSVHRSGASAATASRPARREAERGQLTVMFCDLIGSAQLAGQLDPEDLHGVFRAYHACVATAVRRFDGHVAKVMGASVLAYFGYPQAHEDNAERAIRAGLALIEAIHQLRPGHELTLQVRIGIATGLVMVSKLADARPEQGQTVVGTALNLAARLQASAAPNSVVIADSTRRLAHGLFAYADLGVQDLKGFVEPMRAWRVLGPSRTEDRFEALHAERLTPLVGREEEVALLLSRWRCAKEGDGQVMLLGGEPGVGKSRLVRAFRERLEGERYASLRYQCSPHHVNSALHPLIQELERACGFERDNTATEKLAKLNGLLGSDTADVAAAVSLLAVLLSIPTDGDDPPLQFAPQRQMDFTLEALVAQIERRTRGGPALLTFEDAHWIDSTSLRLLGRLVEGVRTQPALLIVTFRPGFQPSWAQHAHVSALTLGRLGRRLGAVMAEGVAGKALPDEVLDQIARKTDGVPLFVEELTKAVLEAGILREETDRYTLAAPLPSLAIPASLQDSLMTRLGRAGPAMEVAQVGAVIGPGFSHELLAAVAPMSANLLGDALEQLVSSDLVFLRGTPPAATYTFKHALVRDAAYHSLLKSRRRQLHGRIAEVLEEQFPETAHTQPELLAYHCTEGGLGEKGVGYWYEAGRLALGRSAVVEAVAHLTYGLDLLANSADASWRAHRELELQVALGSALAAAHGTGAPETGQAYARALELCDQTGDRSLLSPALYGLVRFHFSRAELTPALELGERALDAARQRDDVSTQLASHFALGWVSLALGRLHAARAHLEQALVLSDALGHELLLAAYGIDLRVTSLVYLSWTLFILGYVDRARELSQRALVEAKVSAHPLTLCVALDRATTIAAFRREITTEAERVDEMLALGKEKGFSAYAAKGDFFRGWMLVEEGRPTEGVASMWPALATLQANGDEDFVPLCLGQLAVAHARAGQLSEALTLVHSGLTRVATTGERLFEPELHRLEGEFLLSLQRRDDAAALRCFRRAIATAREQEARSWELRAATSFARLWRDQGKHARARDLLASIYGWFTEGFDTADLKDAKALLDELA
jgi:class 3 adenylate cyclase/predicted ATPase